MGLTIAEVLREIMDEHRFDQVTIAKELGVTSSYVNQILSGAKAGGETIYGRVRAFGYIRGSGKQGEPPEFVKQDNDAHPGAMTIAEAIRAIRDMKGMTQIEFATLIGIRQPTLSHLESGRTKSLDASITDAIEKVTGIRLYAASDGMVEIDWKDAERLRNVAEFSDQPKLTTTDRRIRVYRQDTDLYVPYYSQAVPAGYPNPTINDSVLRFNMTRYLDGTVIYEVRGDSMIDAGIKEGSRVIVRPTPDFNHSGDVIMALYNRELTVKGVVVTEEGIWLVPVNQDYAPWLVTSSDEFECIGVVVDIWAWPKKEEVRKRFDAFLKRRKEPEE